MWIFLTDRYACIFRCASLASPEPSSPPTAHAALGWHSSSPFHPCAIQITSAPGLWGTKLSQGSNVAERRKVIKENLMAQQTLLGSPLKRARLFQPYQLQLWWVFCCCSSWGNIQVRSPWLPGRGLVSQCQPVAFIPVSLRGALGLLNKVSPLTSMSPEVLTHFEFIETWVLTICFGYSRLVKMLL